MNDKVTADDVVKPFRLAFRSEGSQVNCYFASPETMDGARLISTMPKAVLNADRTIWEDWKRLMERVMAVMCREALGETPVFFDEEVAPEHERSGEA